MNNKPRVFSRFSLAMLLYAGVAILGMLIALRLFNDWMFRYEAALPKNVISEYVSSFDDEDIIRISGDFLSGLNKDIESEEEGLTAVRSLFAGEMTCVKDVGESSKTALSYVVQVDGNDVGRILLKTQDDVSKKYGTVHWEICDESYDFSNLIHSDEIQVPETWTVSFNGHTLDASYRTQTGIEFQEIEDYYADYPELPHMCVYRVDGFCGEYSFQLTDENGSDVTGSSTDDYAVVLDNCTDAEKAEILEYCRNFSDKYVQFNANTGAGFDSNCSQLQALIVPQSEFYKRLPLARDSMQYVRGHFETVDEVSVRRALKLTDHKWAVDMTYICSSGSGDNYVQSSNDLTLILTNTEGKLLAETVKVFPAVVLS